MAAVDVKHASGLYLTYNQRRMSALAILCCNEFKKDVDVPSFFDRLVSQQHFPTAVRRSAPWMLRQQKTRNLRGARPREPCLSCLCNATQHNATIQDNVTSYKPENAIVLRVCRIRLTMSCIYYICVIVLMQ
jgi:hypothetical protein